MDPEDFKKIAELCIRLGCDDLSLTSMSGELFIHKKAVKIIRIAKSVVFKGIACFTNGILLNKHNIEDLLRSGVTSIFISFPGFSESLYEEIFQVNKFGNFKKSVQTLLETHRAIGSKVKIAFEPRTYLTSPEIFESEFYKNCVSQHISDLVYIDEPLYFYNI